MKKLLLSCLILSTLVSCGAPDGTAQDSDGLAPENHRIFVTSTAYTGNLGGQTGADAKCVTAARNAGLVRTYVAILSSTSANANAPARINITGGIYLFSASDTKVLVAGSSEDFWAADNVSSPLLNKVNLDEFYVSTSGVKVWTGTGVEGGLMSGDHCSNWSDSTAGFTGFYGDPDSLVAEWLENSSESCNNSNRIYCISQ